jgi:1-aminocyclopropane-1-carboxylate deaminase/D-cysteine desulfhydrase-like pyridoxal-dependent ACC family enzyme
VTSTTALRALERAPRTHLAHTPTPLAAAPNLAATLGLSADRVWLKLDDYTGFALGGNKVRKLETELSPKRLEGVDTLITCGGPQSNHARVAAAAAAHLGLRCVLVVNGTTPEPPTGNARLHRLLTPEIVPVERREDRDAAMERARAQVEARGGRALVVPIGASTGRGALGYALAMAELDGQLEGRAAWDPAASWVFVATSSGGTLAGMLLGVSILGWHGLRLVGVSADDPAEEVKEKVVLHATEGARLVGFEGPLLSDQVLVTDAFVGEGYGIPTAASEAATMLLARSEGVILDPTYTAKAAAAMVEWARGDEMRSDDRVIFWHTGGHPALLA